MKEPYPRCSVIVLNYFGERIIKNTIDSLLYLDYPKEKLEIIIVDNNSQDKSREIIMNYAEQEKNIKYLFLSKNKGFAGGNNEGIKIARGQYIVLLNNDCIVDKFWLTELVKTVQKDPKIFAVSSKIMLYPKYYLLKFDYRNDLFLENIFLKNSYLTEIEKSRKLFLDVKNKDDAYILEIPYSINDQIITIKNTFGISQQEQPILADKTYSLLNQDGVLKKSQKIIDKNILNIEVKFDVNKFNKKNIYEKIQNAGIVVFQEGSGRDIGAKITQHKQFYEYDYGQYSKETEVYAACGAAVLYNKKILDKIGPLDESFFMYYEDVEISERARLHGYKTFYSPNAEVRHLHAFSSKEWSNFFVYHAERGRLLHTFYNFPIRIFIREYFILALKIMDVLLRVLKNLSDRQRVLKFIRNMIALAYKSKASKGNKNTDFGKVIQYVKILFYFLLNFPILILKRYFKHRLILKNAIRNNYQDILKGKWYF